MNKSIKASQAGFTLIELIVVIVILGILAATALPKFTNLSGEARLASLNAAKGSLVSTSAMMHGKFLANPQSVDATTKKMTVEGTAVDMNLTSGYPVAGADLATASGLGATDYTVYTKASTGTNLPAVSDNQIAIVPNSLVGTPNAAKCFVLYTGATTANAAPTVTVGSTSAALAVDSCQ